jgi:hypothetical protein
MTTPLPPTDPTAPDEPLPGEAELAALYRQLPQTEPSPALDAAVLHAAARALTASENPLAVERRRNPRERGDWVRPKDVPLRDIDSIGVALRERRRRLPSWLLALGSAASLVLVAGLAWHMRGQPTAAVPTDVAPPAPTNASAATALPATPAPDRQAGATTSAMTTKPAASLLLAARPMKAESDTSERDAAYNQRAAAGADATNASPSPPPLVAQVSAQPLSVPPPATSPPVEATPATMVPMRHEARSVAQKATPEQGRELDAIRKLFAEHHDEEAQQRLENFHRSYPQWELAEDLRVHLRKP